MSTFYRRNQEPSPVACVFFILLWAVTGFYLWDLTPSILEVLVGVVGTAVGITLYFGVVALVSLIIVSLGILAISALLLWFED